MSEADRIARAYRDLEQHGARWDQTNLGNQAILGERRKVTRSLLQRRGCLPLGGRRVLEVGSGAGAELAWLLELGAEASNLYGVDLLPDRVAAARRNFPDLHFEVGNAEHLAHANESFDLVMAITVFSSILDGAMAANVAAEMVRVLRGGGALLWYDFRYDSPANRDVRGVDARRVRELFQGFEGELSSLTLLPPLARRLGRRAPRWYSRLTALPPLRSHLIGLLVKPAR